jgi:hypothetical protein
LAGLILAQLSCTASSVSRPPPSPTRPRCIDSQAFTSALDKADQEMQAFKNSSGPQDGTSALRAAAQNLSAAADLAAGDPTLSSPILRARDALLNAADALENGDYAASVDFLKEFSLASGAMGAAGANSSLPEC